MQDVLQWSVYRYYFLRVANRFTILMLLAFSATSCITINQPGPRGSKKKAVYQFVDSEDMIRRFIARDGEPHLIEGVYTVSSSITRKKKALLSSQIKTKVIARQDNYARVAIIRDWSGSNNDFIEISLNEKHDEVHPIVGQINLLNEGSGFIYKHIEPKGEVWNFTFLINDDQPGILDGVHTRSKGNAHYTYSLYYHKTFPKEEAYTLN